MPTPPILDVFVVWHPDDPTGEQRFIDLLAHFHGPAFSGLVGGAVEVYARSAPWGDSDAPRSFGIEDPLVEGLPRAQFNAIVPVLSVEMARAAQQKGWAEFIGSVGALADNDQVGVFSIPGVGVDLEAGSLSQALGRFQTLDRGVLQDPMLLGRELDQAIAQRVRGKSGDASRLTVFVSHAKHRSLAEMDDDAPSIYDSVRVKSPVVV